MKTLVVANWKLNPETLEEAEELTEGVKVPTDNSTEVVFLPPFIFLEELAKKFPHYLWGAQDFFHEDSGAYTGEISLPMVHDVGARWVLVGHSDRRYKFGEDDDLVNKKLLTALRAGFNVVLAVGEKEKGDGDSLKVVESLRASTTGVRDEHLPRLSVAYEPVWAISSSGTGEIDTPQHASNVIKELEKQLSVRYLYGGSVTNENIASFLAMPNINGALIGGASLRPDDFNRILEIAS